MSTRRISAWLTMAVATALIGLSACGSNGGAGRPDGASGTGGPGGTGGTGGITSDGAAGTVGADGSAADATADGDAAETSNATDASADATDASRDATDAPADATDARGDATDAAGEAVDTGPPTKVVFVTSTVYTGDLGGVAGADAKCAARALAAGLSGTFKAWLSDSSGSPATRFTRPAVDYVLADHTTVFAHGWVGLTSGTIPPHALNLTELLGAPPASNNTCAALATGSAAWVSTSADGTPAPGVAAGDHTCANWTSLALQTNAVGFGDPNVAGSWGGFCSTADAICTKVASLYCFEQ